MHLPFPCPWRLKFILLVHGRKTYHLTRGNTDDELAAHGSVPGGEQRGDKRSEAQSYGAAKRRQGSRSAPARLSPLSGPVPGISGPIVQLM